jgi:hypothetical protein
MQVKQQGLFVDLLNIYLATHPLIPFPYKRGRIREEHQRRDFAYPKLSRSGSII